MTISINKNIFFKKIKVKKVNENLEIKIVIKPY